MKLSDKTQAIIGCAAGVLIAASLTCVSLACGTIDAERGYEPIETLPLVTEVTGTPDNVTRTFVDEIERPVILSGYYGNAYSWEYDMLCRIVELEAGGESVECRAAVTAVILNRLASGIWGETLSDVLTADQFETVPFAHTADVQKSTADVVADVWANGCAVPADVLFFRDTYYHTFCGAVDEFAVGAMYFSSSVWCEVE
jgi:hypothetical protein